MPFNKKRSYGFLEVVYSKTIVTLSYCGNMGAREGSIAECFDKLFGKDSWKRVKPLFYSEQGSPDYAWVAKVDRSKFDRAFP